MTCGFAGVADGLSGNVSADPAAWTATCLDRVESRDKEIRAWAFVDPEGAMERASAPGLAGPLKGLPVGIKDVIDVAGMPTGCNSPIEAGRIAATNAGAVQRLADAGAVMLGKTVTTEYAFLAPGPTVNPHDPARTPGGSSSGSAAAVADGHVPVALTTQTGGSTIRPAAFCGIVGYKPPFGTVPNSGLKLLAPSLDTIGLHARSVADIAAVATVLEAQPRSAEPVRSPSFVLLRLPFEAALNPVNTALLANVAESLRAAGARVREADAPPAFEKIDAAHPTIMAPQVARTFAAGYRDHKDLLSDSLRAFIERGEKTSGQSITEAHAVVAEVHRGIQALAVDGEILLCPATEGEAPPGLESTGSAIFCRPWTQLHYASLTLPAGFGPAGLPLGLQLVDPSPAGGRLFGHAAFAEAALATHKPEETAS